MAKKKDKKKGKGSAAKLPKRIAGVKVPKELRAPGGKLMEVVRNPLVMDLAAAALVAAAAGLREGKGRGSSGGDGPRTGTDRGGSSELGVIIASKAIESVRKLAAGAPNGGPRGEGGRQPGNGQGPGTRNDRA